MKIILIIIGIIFIINILFVWILCRAAKLNEFDEFEDNYIDNKYKNKLDN